MEIECTFTCAYCFQENSTTVDPTAGNHQEYIEDCEVCCRPNLLVITVAADLAAAEINATPA